MFLIEGVSVYKVDLIVRLKTSGFFVFFLVNLALFLHFLVFPIVFNLLALFHFNNQTLFFNEYILFCSSTLKKFFHLFGVEIAF